MFDPMYGADIPAHGMVVESAATVTPPAGNLAGGWRALIDPHNGLVWVGLVLLVTVGAAGAAGSVRLGRAKVSASVGQD
jgi:hypothetical protein